MRPATIAWFERLYIISVTISFFFRFRDLPRMTADFGPIAMLIILALFLMIPVALALFVSRRRSRVALIFLILLTWALGFLVASGLFWLGRLSLVELVGYLIAATPIAATLLLFTPSARDWLKASAPQPVSPEKLQSTFE